jgi:hypothetical protein
MIPYALRITVFGLGWKARPARASQLCGSGLDKRFVIQARARRENQRIRRRIEIRQLVVSLPLRRYELITDAQIQRQFACSLEIVLQISEIHALGASARPRNCGSRIGCVLPT